MPFDVIGDLILHNIHLTLNAVERVKVMLMLHTVVAIQTVKQPHYWSADKRYEYGDQPFHVSPVKHASPRDRADNAVYMQRSVPFRVMIL